MRGDLRQTLSSGLFAVDAAHDEIDFFQAFERLQIDLPVPRFEIVPFHEQIAEIAREIGMRKIVLVMRPRRHERDACIFAAAMERQCRL